MVHRSAIVLAVASLLLTRAQGVAQSRAGVIESEPHEQGYDGGGRRDPFVRPTLPGVEEPKRDPDVRAPGLAGVSTEEAVLTGTFQGRDGGVAVLRAADGRTYVVRPGDRLADGAIVSIGTGVVTIRQSAQHERASENQREVRKELASAGGGA